MDYLTPQMHRRIIIYCVDATYDFDFTRQRYEVSTSSTSDLINLPFDRNAMFLAIMRDWLRLIEGLDASNHLVPRLQDVSKSSELIATAWESRQFNGCVRKEIA